jgi:hypothetical protein
MNGDVNEHRDRQQTKAVKVSSVGKVWLSLLIKHFEACKAGDEKRRAQMLDLLDGIEAEFPQAIADEMQRCKDYAGG